MTTNSRGVKTRCVHSGLAPDPTTGSVAQPIYPSSTYEWGSRRRGAGYIYSRTANPNREAFEHALADLEGGEAALAFSSGSAAITALLLALPHGAEALMPEDFYMGTRRILWEMFAERLLWRHADMRQIDAVRRAMSRVTRLVYLETPSNPLLHISDIETISSMAHEAGAVVAVDNTWPTPVLQRPFEFGADVIVHSASKYIGGHSDLVMGALVFREKSELYERCRQNQVLGGGVPSPPDCWMARRGLMTLALRMEAHCRNAQAVAEWLAGREDVKEVFYPGLAKGRQRDLARKQMSASGGVLSFTLEGGEAAAVALPKHTRMIVNATSLGGVESLMEHRATAEGEDTRIPRDLVRLSVGIEDVDDIIADLESALAQTAKR